MTVRANQVLRRIEAALEAATREEDQGSWRVHSAQMLLWLRDGDSLESGAVAIVHPGGGWNRGARYAGMHFELHRPFRPSKLLDDLRYAAPLRAGLETALHTVNSVVLTAPTPLLAVALRFGVRVRSNGQLVVGRPERQAQPSPPEHLLLLGFALTTNEEEAATDAVAAMRMLR